MTEQVAVPVENTAPPKKKRSKSKKKWIKRIIAILVVLALLAGIAFGLWYLVFREDETVGAPLTDFAHIGTIQSVVQGYGTAVPKESAAITLTAKGTVEEVFVTVGQQVFAGQPLYTIDSQSARDELAAAQEKLDALYADLSDLHESAADLTVRAPFAGKLQEVVQFTPDEQVASGTTVTTLVNDRQLKLSLYYSYAYEQDIQVGQAATVTVPAVMGSFTGTVEQVHKVRYISPEGGVHFEVVVVFDNPGTLTAGMDASAVLTAGDGSVVYPYQMAKTEFYETRVIRTGAAGPVTAVGNLRNYADVAEGEVLLALGTDTIDADIRAKEEAIALAQQDLDKIAEGMGNFNAVAPIDGMVFSCTLQPGMEVKEGETVITISNTTSMLVDIQVDSRNIGFIQAGMEMELTDDWGNPCYGTVISVPMQGEVGTGVTTYPVQLEVDNSAGTIYNGSWLNYKLVTSESADCILIPNQCVKRVTDVDGNIHTVVFVQAESAPENTVELDPAMLGETMPTTDEGFWPIPVTVGISDTYNVEITDGLEVDTVVFTNRETDQSYGW